MIDILTHFAAWCVPRICVGCGFTSDNLHMDLCSGCKRNLPWLEERCYKCGVRIQQPKEAIICVDCISCPPPYERVCALFSYAPPLNNLVNRLKFNRDLYPGKLFANLLLDAVVQRWYLNKSLPEVIIPVPLHERRHKMRGYNQALEISLPLARALNIPVDLQICKRIRNTPPQARLNKAQRTTNLAKAFVASVSNYEHVVLIDDVVTTGSTIRAVSATLLNSGVKLIEVWCICRA